MTLDPIGIVGSGPVAAAMVARVASAGVRVVYYGLPEAPVQGKKLRIERAPNLFDLASECEVVIAAYDSHKALRAALTGDDDRPGLLGAMRPGALLIDASEGLPDETRRLAGQLAAGAIGLVELAVLGGADGIAEGKARIFAGGFGEHIVRVTSALTCLGSLKRIGPQGSARMYVALSESVRAAYHIALAEAHDIAAASGFVPEELAAPPLSNEEQAQLAASVNQALAQAQGTPAPLLTALADVLGQSNAVRQP